MTNDKTMAASWWNGSHGHFTADVLSGKIRQANWLSLRNQFFPDGDQQQAWAQLRAWAAEHRITYDVQEWCVGKGTEIRVRFYPPPTANKT